MPSQHHKAAHYNWIQDDWQLLMYSSSPDIRTADYSQMINGKLTEMGRERQNIPVTVPSKSEGAWAHLYQQDASGTFLELEPEPWDCRRIGDRITWRGGGTGRGEDPEASPQQGYRGECRIGCRGELIQGANALSKVRDKRALEGWTVNS